MSNKPRTDLKESRQKEAAERQAEHAALSPEDKLAKMRLRRGESNREKGKLTGQSGAVQ